MVYEKKLNIYADGSCFSNPRRGGMGVRFVTINEAGNEVVQDEQLPGHAGATNNEMELLACIKGLELAFELDSVDRVDGICVFTDSMYVTSNVNRAKFEWPRRKWCTQDDRPVENAELWKDLIRLLQKAEKRVEFEWVKGHSKDVHNRAVDKLAKQSAKGVLGRPLKVTAVRRKQSAEMVQRGCIPMQGQVLSIRIITDTYMRVQKIYKYKYEVLPGSGDYSGNVDFMYHKTNECLRAGHHYEVKVNDQARNPRIVEVVQELERASSAPPEQTG